MPLLLEPALAAFVCFCKMFWLLLYRGSPLVTNDPLTTRSRQLSNPPPVLPFCRPLQFPNYPLEILNYLLQILNYLLQILNYPLQVLSHSACPPQHVTDSLETTCSVCF